MYTVVWEVSYGLVNLLYFNIDRYDFAPPFWTFDTYALVDRSMFTRPLNALTIANQRWDWHNSTDPIYIDRQGLFFDHQAKILIRPNFPFNNHPLGATYLNVRSFSAEVWVKFNYTLYYNQVQNNFYVLRKMGGTYWSM